MSDSLVPYDREFLMRGEPFYSSFYNPPLLFPTQESSETAIARREPLTAFELLREMSKDKLSKKALETAATISNSYLSYLPKEKLRESNGISISFKRKKRFLSGRDYGFILDIDLK